MASEGPPLPSKQELVALMRDIAASIHRVDTPELRKRYRQSVMDRGVTGDVTDWFGTPAGSGSPLVDGAGQTGQSIETHGWRAETTDKETPNGD